jgi:DMSO/TMAO reductase YedYZ molybdopterin-dependent catalytic subunit
MKRDKDGAVLPAGRRQGELTDLITSNDDFYVVTKNAAGDPVLQAASWRLRVDGEVEHPIELDYASLRRLPPVELVRTVECISNLAAKCELAPFGCDLISTARWTGVRLASLLQLAGGVKPDTTSIAVLAADEYTSGVPLEVAMDPDALLVYEMNGQLLPREHGYPARLLVPNRYGMKNAKWVVGLRAVRREFVDWYGQRNWSKDGIVKTMTRIDLPPRGTDLPPGEYNIAGVAYAGARGVDHVEFSSDGGATWQTASFVESPVAREAWVRWIARFSLEPDAHLTLIARATDGTGATQPQPFSLPEPDGSGGWPSLEVQAQPSS